MRARPVTVAHRARFVAVLLVGWLGVRLCGEGLKWSQIRILLAVSSVLLLLYPRPAEAQTGFLSADLITGQALSKNDRSAVVLIHGWTMQFPDNPPTDAFVDDEGWSQLVAAFQTRLQGTGSKLLQFHWEKDASTGPVVDCTEFQKDRFCFAYLLGFSNASRAAEMAFLNGKNLATSLEAASGLRRVTFVAHSAGSWVAYRAVDILLEKNSNIVANVVLLDPFIPGVGTIKTILTKARMELLASQNRIYRLENYFAVDITDTKLGGAGSGFNATSQVFNWRSSDVNHAISISKTCAYSPCGHSYPKKFFAEKVAAWPLSDFTATRAQLLTPEPESTLGASTVQLQYSGGTGVTKYWVYVGRSRGGNDIYNQDRGTNLTATVSGLPTDGSTVYVKLWSQIDGVWQSNHYTYKAATVAATARAQLVTPAPESTLSASTMQLQYSAGTGVTRYWVYVGTTRGANDISDQDRGTSLTATVSGLPTNGSTIYVQLWSQINGKWESDHYTYRAATIAAAPAPAQLPTPAPAQLLTPAPASTLSASTVQLQYSGGTGVTKYWVWVGTTKGGNDIYDQDRGTSLTATVSGLPTNGGTIYVQLWSLINGDWQWNDYTYKATTIAATARAQLLTPAAGSTLGASTVQLQYSGGTGVSRYWVWVGTTKGGNDLYNQDRGTSLTATVSGLPTNGSTIYVGLWSFINGTWQSNDYTYKAATVATTARAQLLSPAPESTLTASTVQLEYSGGTGVTRYRVWVGTTKGGSDIFDQDRGTSLTATVSGLPTDGGTIHVQLWSFINGTWEFNQYTYKTATIATIARAQLLTPAPGSTLAGSTVQLQYSGGTGVTRYWLWVGTTKGGHDLSDQDRGTSLTATVSGLPTDGGTIYVELWSYVNGAWQSNGYTYKAATVSTTARAQLLTPAPGSTLAGSTVQLQYSGGTGVSRYWVWVGTTKGGNDLHNQDRGTSLSTTVSGLPTNGSTIYVELWSFINGTWQSNDYTYKAATVATTARAQLLTPAPESTLSASTVQLLYSGGTGVTRYWVWVGTTKGGNNIFDQDRGTSLTATVSGLPTNGSTIYVQLWSQINGTWEPNQYTYKATTTTGTITVPPSQPSSPNPGSTSSPGPTISGSAVMLSWSSSGGATYYGLGVRDMVTGALVVDGHINGTSHAVTLSAGKHYRWNVNACNAAGCSAFTTVLYFQTPVSITVPVTPSNLTPGSIGSPGTTTSGSTVTVSWSGSSGATYYGLAVRDVTTGALVVDTTVNGTGYTANLSAGRQYRWNVNACNSAGCSAYATVLYFKTPNAVTVPVTPSSPSPGSTSSPGPTTSSRTVTLSWGGSSGASYYGVAVRDITSGVLVVDTTISGTSYSVTLSSNRQYRWNVNACNTSGCSSYTPVRYFKTP